MEKGWDGAKAEEKEPVRRTAFSKARPVGKARICCRCCGRRSSESALILLRNFLSSAFDCHELVPLLRARFGIMSVSLPPFNGDKGSRRFICSCGGLTSAIVHLSRGVNFRGIALVNRSVKKRVILGITRSGPRLMSRTMLLYDSKCVGQVGPRVVFSDCVPFFRLCIGLCLRHSKMGRGLGGIICSRSVVSSRVLCKCLSPFLRSSVFQTLAEVVHSERNSVPTSTLGGVRAPYLLV